MTPSATVFVSFVILAYAAFMVTLGWAAVFTREPPRQRADARSHSEATQAQRIG
jgi:hypothetical protein